MAEIYQDNYLNISTQKEILHLKRNQTEIMEKIIQGFKNLKNEFEEMKMEVNHDVGNDEGAR